MLDSILAGLDEFFGFHHSMILLPGDQPQHARRHRHARLSGARRRRRGALRRGHHRHGGRGPAADPDLGADARDAVRLRGASRAEAHGLCPEELRIPLPGLQSPASQLGVPLLARGELVGVLVLESETPYRFHEEDRATIELLGSYLALAIQNGCCRRPATRPKARRPGAPAAPAAARRPRRRPAARVARWPSTRPTRSCSSTAST